MQLHRSVIRHFAKATLRQATFADEMSVNRICIGADTPTDDADVHNGPFPRGKLPVVRRRAYSWERMFACSDLSASSLCGLPHLWHCRPPSMGRCKRSCRHTEEHRACIVWLGHTMHGVHALTAHAAHAAAGWSDA